MKASLFYFGYRPSSGPFAFSLWCFQWRGWSRETILLRVPWSCGTFQFREGWWICRGTQCFLCRAALVILHASKMALLLLLFQDGGTEPGEQRVFLQDRNNQLMQQLQMRRYVLKTQFLDPILQGRTRRFAKAPPVCILMGFYMFSYCFHN